MDARTTTLYRYFDATGLLLYVGMSGDGYVRAGQHARVAQWWHLAATAKLEHFPSREAALTAELAAIREEMPLHNRRDHPARVRPDRKETRPASPRPARTSAWVGEAKRLRQGGLTVRQIADAVGIPAATVASALREDRDLRRARLQHAWRELITTIHRAGWPRFEIDP